MNNSNENYVAELRNWVKAGQYYYGEIYGDKKNRFEDGKVVRTSKVIEDVNANGIITTKNSKYKLISGNE